MKYILSAFFATILVVAVMIKLSTIENPQPVPPSTILFIPKVNQW